MSTSTLSQAMSPHQGHGTDPDHNLIGRYVIVILSLTACTLVDYITGSSVSVFALYFLSVATSTYLLGTVVGSLNSVVAVGLWATVQQLLGSRQGWALLLSGLDHWACLVVVVYAVHSFRLKQRMMAVSFDALLGQQPPVCTQCHRLGGHDSYWRPFDTHVAEFGGPPVKHKVCPDCARAIYARAGYREADPEQSTP